MDEKQGSNTRWRDRYEEETAVRDAAEREKAMAMDMAQKREICRHDTIRAALDRLQYLAYVTARRDVDHDLPNGVAELDPVFAIIRQLIGVEAA
jgi:hypothetical protein